MEYRKAVAGKPTLFLLNGLTWSTTQWQPFVEALNKLDPELGIVLYDMEGMGQTLLSRAPITFDIPFPNQVTDLKDLRDSLDIRGPLVLAGLSYGGGVALEYMARYPDDFTKVIAMAPFLEALPDQDKWIRDMIRAVRWSFPLNGNSDTDLYNFFLRVLVYGTYPIAERVMLENPYKSEGVFRMVKGALPWRAVDIVDKLPEGKVHLLAGENDPHVKLAWLRTFWQAIPAAARASFAILKDTEHKLPQERPDLTASWVVQILRDNPELKKGLTFNVDPATGEGRSEESYSYLRLGYVSCCCERSFVYINKTGRPAC